MRFKARHRDLRVGSREAFGLRVTCHRFSEATCRRATARRMPLAAESCAERALIPSMLVIYFAVESRGKARKGAERRGLVARLF